MPAILTGVKPSGEATPYQKFMQERGVAKTRAFAILRCDQAPQTFMLGSTRMIDRTIGLGWFAALADGQFTMTVDDLSDAAAPSAT